MTNDSSLPIAGWYPDPDEPETHMRYWDGYAWQLREPRMSDRQFLPPWLPVPLGIGFHRLGITIRIAIWVSVAIAAAQIALYAWGRSMFADAVMMGDVDQLDRYDNVELWFSLAMVIAVLVAAVTWMVWQFRLARATHPDALRRGPNWHAWAWVVPVVSLWFPFQNVKDLWVRYLPGRPTAVLGWWWAFYLGTQVTFEAYGNAYEDAQTVDALESASLIGTASAVVSIVAALLVLRVHRTLDAAAIRRAVTPDA